MLLHEDAEILDLAFCDVVRRTFADPAVTITGPIGARGIDCLAWWEGEIVGSVQEPRATISGGASAPDVDALDGLMLVLSPWAVAELRFDNETFTGFHGYDVDVCFEARAIGHAVRVAPLRVFHHTKSGLATGRSGLPPTARSCANGPSGSPARA